MGATLDPEWDDADIHSRVEVEDVIDLRSSGQSLLSSPIWHRFYWNRLIWRQ